MRNPLDKRIGRELVGDIGKYIAQFLFLTLTIGFVSGFLIAGTSMKTSYDESFEKYNIEDGHFTLSDAAPESLLTELRDDGVTVYPLLYKNFDLGNSHTARIYKIRRDVDLICLMRGKMPESDGDIAIDRLYAENNDIKLGSELEIGGKSFTVVGFTAFSDYSALFKNNTDMMLDANKFTVACVTDAAFDELGDAGLKYNYAWVCDDDTLDDAARRDKADEIMKSAAKTGLLTDFVKVDDNMAIKFTGDDIGGDSVMVITLLYIVMAVIAFVFGITTRNTIENESGAIGTLRASGYTRGELVRHYMILPCIVTISAAVVGNILGYTLFKDLVAGMYYHSYSLPTYVTLWNTRAFVMTTVIPCLIVVAVVLPVLYESLKNEPLKFLRRELGSERKKNVVKLKHFGFITRFRLRVIFRNMSSYVTLLVGVMFASLLLLFGLMLSPMLKSFKSEVIGSKIADYQYILKAPVSTENESAEKYAVCSLLNEKGEEITIYGIDENSRYFGEKLGRGTILLSDGITEKYRIEPGDEITLHEKYDEDKTYTVTASGEYHYPATLAVFMNREDFCRMFDRDEDYFCGYFTNEKLGDIDEKYVSTIITESDLTIMADQLDDSMGQSFFLLCGFSVLIYIILIYLLSKQVIEKDQRSISMIKILGFNDREISSIFNVTTGIVMILSLLLSMPVSYVLIKKIYYLMMLEYNGWLTFRIEPYVWPLMFVFGAACYAVVHLITMRRIRRIPPGDALKDIE